MNIASTDSSQQHIQYGDDSFDELLNRLEDLPSPETYYLSLFIGQSKKQKDEAIQKIEKHTDRKIHKVDCNALISENESETRERLDQLFDNFASEEFILYLTHGANLCGAYTGYTLSRVKYASPQERYFLKKMQEVSGFIIIDFEDAYEVDRTPCRAANSLVTFELSNSFFKKFIWNLKNIRVQGSNLSTKRPTHKGKTAGNF